MEFGWINFFGAMMIVLIMIPNILYAIKNKGESAEGTHNRAMLLAEQIGRYACIVLMWLPFPVWKFDFSSRTELLLYVFGNLFLLAAYYIFWILYSRKKRRGTALALAVIPTCIFLLSGVLLHHWLLVFAAVLFGIGHISITAEGKYAA